MRLRQVAAAPLRRNLRVVPIVVLIAAVFVVSVYTQRPGHDWGDDFALYLRQSRALVEGNVGEVLASNRYMVQESSGSGFSPYSYPWGTPILLAPVVAVFGIDYAKLKVLEALFFAGFLAVLYRLALRRAGPWGALGITAFVGANTAFIGWTDAVLSEMPFVLFIGLSLLWMDRIREGDLWEAGPKRPLIVCGILLGFTYSIRREGIALVLALIAAHLVFLWRRRRSGGDSPVPWRRLALPYASAAGFTALLQLVLPTVVLPRYDDVGLHNLIPNLIWFRDVLAEDLGLLRNGALELLGSHSVAVAVLTVFLTMAVLGALVRVLVAAETDAPWTVLVLCLALIMGVLPFHEHRYILSMVPFMAYFAYQAVAAWFEYVPAWKGKRRWWKRPDVFGLAFILVFIAANVPNVVNRVDYRRTYGAVAHWGPEDPQAQDMFDAVRSHTRRDELLAFMRARAMALYTDRTTLQLLGVGHVLERVDWYVMEKDSTYSQVLLTPEEAAAAGLSMEWENDKYVLWRVPDR